MPKDFGQLPPAATPFTGDETFPANQNGFTVKILLSQMLAMITQVWVGLGNVTNDAQVKRTEMGVANGVATLDGSAKLPLAQLPIQPIVFQGIWNANTNTPTITPGVGTKGYLYKVGTAGTTSIDGINSWAVGDSIVFNGTVWDKINGAPTEVTSVAGRTGAVVLSNTDISGLGSAATHDANDFDAAGTAAALAKSTARRYAIMLG